MTISFYYAKFTSKKSLPMESLFSYLNADIEIDYTQPQHLTGANERIEKFDLSSIKVSIQEAVNLNPPIVHMKSRQLLETSSSLPREGQSSGLREISRSSPIPIHPANASSFEPVASPKFPGLVLSSSRRLSPAQIIPRLQTNRGGEVFRSQDEANGNNYSTMMNASSSRHPSSLPNPELSRIISQNRSTSSATSAIEMKRSKSSRHNHRSISQVSSKSSSPTASASSSYSESPSMKRESSSYIGRFMKEAFFVSTFASHQVVSVASNLFHHMFRGVDRPTWSSITSMGLYWIRANAQFPYLSIDKGRIPFVEFLLGDNKAVSITVDVDMMLQYEALGHQYHQTTSAAKYGIPPELHLPDPDLHDGIRRHRISGEWFYPTPEEAALYRDKPAPDRNTYAGKTIFYIHGGAYVLGSVVLYRQWTQRIAIKTKCRVFSVDYRLAPEDPFPAALHDIFAAYLWLIDPQNVMFQHEKGPRHVPINPNNIVVMGDSAGGGFAMSLLNYLNLYLRNQNGIPLVPFPYAAVLYSPWVDLSCSSKSWEENKKFDWLPPNASNIHQKLGPNLYHPAYYYCFGRMEEHRGSMALLSPSLESLNEKCFFPDDEHLEVLFREDEYKREIVDRFVRHPLVSPVFADDFTDLPPILIQAGECEFLRDESIALAYKIKNWIEAHQARSGYSYTWVRHELYTDMVHDFQAVPWLPAAKVAMKNTIDFLNQVFGWDNNDPLTSEEARLVKLIDSHTTHV